MARVSEDDGGQSQPAVVLLEDADGGLEVAAASGPLPAWLQVTDGARLADLVAPEDRSRLAAAREAVGEGTGQRACRVRLGRAGVSDPWYEARFLTGLVPDRTVVLVRDVMSEQRVAAEAALLRRMTELANAGRDIDAVAAQAVTDVRTTMGWLVGHVLVVTDGTLVEAGGWDAERATEELADLLGDGASLEAGGVAAAAADRAAPVTSGEVDARARLAQLEQAGVAAVVALPIIAAGEVVRVLELFAAAPVALDDDQRSLLAEVGHQLGSVVARQRYLEELEASHTELERSNAELERFAYVASHDLQEPLRKIVGFTELLQDRYESRDDEEREFQQYIVQSAHRLQELIKDLLAFSRAGRRELAVEPVDLGETVAIVCSDLELAIDDAQATVEVGDLPVVLGDDGQLREVLQNLIGNALKYAAADDRPSRVTVTGSTEGDTARIVVADNGIGVDPTHREAIFEVFRRLHPSHVYAGTGLGLALVKRIVERHEGTVETRDSPLGDGIAVHVTLPSHREQA